MFTNLWKKLSKTFFKKITAFLLLKINLSKILVFPEEYIKKKKIHIKKSFNKNLFLTKKNPPYKKNWAFRPYFLCLRSCIFVLMNNCKHTSIIFVREEIERECIQLFWNTSYYLYPGHCMTRFSSKYKSSSCTSLISKLTELKYRPEDTRRSVDVSQRIINPLKSNEC